ncbi:MAG: hypothetical protein FWG82_02255 [Oscillospiraceae bacterium]|nr:hypothetical protein [Oscillospiraceae bacterium]
MQTSIQKKLTEPLSLKAAVYRATAIMFIIQLFGALGAGLIFVVSSVLGITVPVGNEFWQIFLHIAFWATDFAFVGFTMILAYLIAGLPAIAPSLTLAVFYSHFAGLYGGGIMRIPLYTDFFVPPASGAGGWNIGYMGFLLIALGVGYGTRWLFLAWNSIKNALAPKLDKVFGKIDKLKELKGITILEGTDLVVLILILPFSATLITYFAVQYGIAIPFKELGVILQPVVTDLFRQGNNLLVGLLMGAMVGADTIGPLSMSAFRAATSAAINGNALPMTAYALAFASTGWVSFVAFLINKVFKRGGKMDTDDMNIAMSGPINVIFDNMKLTVAFGMPFAYRSPASVIPATVVTTVVTALLACAFGVKNALYTSQEMLNKFIAGDFYTSFAQPHLKLGENSNWFLTLLAISVGVIAGAVVLIALRELLEKLRKNKAESYEPNGDIIIELRQMSQASAENYS